MTTPQHPPRTDRSAPAEAAEAFAHWIARTGFSDATQRLYARRARAFLTWVGEKWEEYDGALDDAHVRDYAVRDYRRHLMTEAKVAVSTLEGCLSAIGTFYEWRGLGRPNVKRMAPPQGFPKGLPEDQLRRVLRAAERRGPRDLAILHVLFGTAVRVSELVAIDTDDVFISERMGTLEVRHGKGGLARQVPVPADARAAIRSWHAVRRQLGTPEVGPLFLSRTGARISVRRVQSLLADIGAETGTDLHPHVMRHTFARRFLASGGDLGALRQILGHASIATTQGYVGAGAQDLADMAERVAVEL
jgi:integrase/recombinase XerC